MVEEKIDAGNESDTTLHASEKQELVESIADGLLSLQMKSLRDDDMHFYAGKEEFSIILELDELEDLQFDKTGPKSLLSVLRECYKDGVGLRKYSIDAEDMEDVIEIIFKNEKDRTKALVAHTAIQGHELYVHKPLGTRAPYLYHIDIFDVPFGDQKKKLKQCFATLFGSMGPFLVAVFM